MVTAHPPSNVVRTVLLTDPQIDMIRFALGEYLATFSFHEGDIMHEIKVLLRSLTTVDTPHASTPTRWTTSQEGSGLMGEDQDGGEKSPPRNAVVVRQAIEEIWNQGNLDLADTLFTGAYVNLGGLVPDLVRGPEAIKIAAALHHTAFPRLHITIERMIAEGAHVAFQWIARNQAVGDEVTPTPSASQGSLRGMTFCRLAAGKIAESWTSWDTTRVRPLLVRAADVGPDRDAPRPSSLS